MVALVVVAAFTTGMLAGANIRGGSPGTPADYTIGHAPDNILDSVRFYGMGDNNTTVIAMNNSTFVVLLAENPTTGYRWSVNCTGGLTVIGDRYIPSDTQLVGSGGTHAWAIAITDHGEQTFSAVNARPWEPGTEGEFKLTIYAHNVDENSLP